MALHKFTGVLFRQWLVVLVGAVCTIAAGLAAMHDPGIYFTRTNLVFLAPTSSNYPNALRTQSTDVIDTAGLVAKRLTGPGEVTKYASPDVTLVGLGVRDGWSLRLPDTGGQWATNFATQMLVLDVVGPTREIVEQRRDYLVQRTAQELDRMQRDAGVAPVNDITVIPAPASAVVHHVTGNRLRALGMTALLGVGLTGAAALVVDRRRSGRAAVPRQGSRSEPGEGEGSDVAALEESLVLQPAQVR